ncbi:MAG: maleylpyruvate isomerase N-terminal domain-containing protein [Candidatus Dormibacteria bacterium]
MAKSEDQPGTLALAERAGLVEDLTGLSAEQWRHVTLCEHWDVGQVVAHLIAGASLNRRQWLLGMLGARFHQTFTTRADCRSTSVTPRPRPWTAFAPSSTAELHRPPILRPTWGKLSCTPKISASHGSFLVLPALTH